MTSIYCKNENIVKKSWKNLAISKFFFVHTNIKNVQIFKPVSALNLTAWY